MSTIPLPHPRTHCEHGERLEEYCSECLQDIASGTTRKVIDSERPHSTPK